MSKYNSGGKNYYISLNAPPREVNLDTKREIIEKYDSGYSLQGIIDYVAHKEHMSKSEAQRICEKTIINSLSRRKAVVE